jgi:hypothetical protein
MTEIPLPSAMTSGVFARHEAIQWADNKQIYRAQYNIGAPRRKCGYAPKRGGKHKRISGDVAENGRDVSAGDRDVSVRGGK